MRRIFWIICGCLMVWAMILLYVGLSHGMAPNPNLKNGIYIVKTTSAKSLRQFYWDLGRYVTYESLPEFLREKMNAVCRKHYGKTAEYVGDVRNFDDMSLEPICASAQPFPNTLIVQICARLEAQMTKWVFAWTSPKEHLFACKKVGFST